MPSSLPNLGFQTSDPRYYIKSWQTWVTEAQIRSSPSPWLESLLLAWSHTFSVGETFMAPEAKPKLECLLGYKLALGPSAWAPCRSKFSQGLDQEPAYGACQAPMIPIFTRARVFHLLEPRTVIWSPSPGRTPEPDSRTPPFPQNVPKILRAGPTPQRGRLFHSP